MGIVKEERDSKGKEEMTQYTEHQIFEMLKDLPFGSAVLMNTSKGQKIAIIGGIDSSELNLMFHDCIWKARREFYGSVGCAPISAIKPKGFAYSCSNSLSPFEAAGYYELVRRLVEVERPFSCYLVEFPPPESSAQKNLREAEAKLAEAQEAVKKAREGLG